MIFDMIEFKYSNLIASIVIRTFGILSTRVTKAFIDICNGLRFVRMRNHSSSIIICTYALLSWISLESLRTLTPVGGPVVEAPGVEAAGVVLALVEAAAVGVGVTSRPRRTLAHEASVLVDAPRPGTTRVTQTLVEVSTLSKCRWSEII